MQETKKLDISKLKIENKSSNYVHSNHRKPREEKKKEKYTCILGIVSKRLGRNHEKEI